LIFVLAGCAGRTPTGADESVPQGIWGGDHVSLTVDTRTAAVEFDCAHGTLSVPIPLDGGRFDVTGVFVLERGGPIHLNEDLPRLPARFSGFVDGRDMRLRVTLADTGQEIGTYTLKLGASGRLIKCL